jgi:spore coat protein U-like protein
MQHRVKKEHDVKRFNRLLGKVAIGGGTILAAAALATPASAQSATSNLSVTTSVANNCTITTAPVAFGAYDPVVVNVATPLDGTGSVTVACTQGSSATIGLGLGGNASGSTRRMNGGGNFITYELYQDTGRTTVWSNAGAGLLSPAAAPSVAPRSFTVYGRVAAAQSVPAGAYNDSVLATVNF